MVAREEPSLEDSEGVERHPLDSTRAARPKLKVANTA